MNTQTQEAGPALKAGLWLAQALIAAMFLTTAYFKLTVPIAVLSNSFPWTGQVNPALVTFTGIVDGLGGIGILLPSLTRIQPRLTVYAAMGCLLLQIVALVFHISRNEGLMAGPFNVVFGVFAAFVWWGRSSRAPIAPR